VPPPPHEPPPGSEAPLKAEHSLPSYHEPTPETHRHISREEEAELALKNTVFTPGARTAIIALFLLTILAVPTIQLGAELRAAHSDGLPMLAVFQILPGWKQLRAARGPSDLWRLLPHPAEIKAAEKTLENESVIAQHWRPHVQEALTGSLRAGSEQAYPGRDGWLFYRPDVEYITGPPFLAPTRLRQRAHAAEVQPDPIKAIVEFRDELAARGIELIVLPVPVKPGIDGEMLSGETTHAGPRQNASFAEFKARLAQFGVRVFDPAPLLAARKTAAGGAPLYLATDTHWRPETMTFVARELAAFLHAPPPAQAATFQIVETEVAGLGDLATMLKLPAGQRLFPPQKVPLQQIAAGNAWWRPSSDASILLLGDSFANIFSFDAMGWGEAAGFAEHLSYALGQPLDCLLRNSDGAFATRELLSRELARGRDRLAGKTHVVWEFAARELAFGNWKLLEMKSAPASVAHFLSPSPGDEVVATGTVLAVSPAPRPGTVPYKDHLVTVHLGDLQSLPPHETETGEALAYLWSMRDNVWTRAARLRPGERITVHLRAWSDVSEQYEKINRSEIDDPALQLEEPAWAELAD
jgi:alginate O-acetyltransferase complex protein AlgJ